MTVLFHPIVSAGSSVFVLDLLAGEALLCRLQWHLVVQVFHLTTALVASGLSSFLLWVRLHESLLGTILFHPIVSAGGSIFMLPLLAGEALLLRLQW